MKDSKLATKSNLFEGIEIRSIWDPEKEEYYFSVVDVVKALTGSNIPKRYWSDLKRKLDEEEATVRKYRTVEDESARWKVQRDGYT